MLLTCCHKDENDNITITEGYYEGFFANSNDTIWEAISFKTDSFIEQPSGGLPLGAQKFPCIVKGTFKINQSEINFDLSEYPRIELQCDSDIILSGTYDFQIASDSMIFWKGEGIEKQIYKLKNITASR
jgi:hypothetical protein